MRMRKKKNLAPRMEACGMYLIKDPFSMRGRWRELMPAARELRVELGCGKGGFTVGTAAAEPDVLLIAVEKVPDAMVVAMEKARDAGVHNVWFVDGDAALLPDMFAEGEIDRLYINFCDPWPKTDNDKLFEWSLEEIPQFGFRLSEVTRDLHADGAVGVMTDYERKFFSEGKSINRCVATMVDWTEPENDTALSQRISE